MRKGFASLLFLGIGTLMVVAAIVGVLVYIGSRVSSQKALVANQPQNSLPPAANVRPDNFTLVNVLQDGFVAYSNPKLDLTFQYPKSFVATVGGMSSYPFGPVFTLGVNTPDVPTEKRQATGFDFNAYDTNTMVISVEEYVNATNLTLDNFLSKLYSGTGIDGKTPIIVTLRKNLVSSDVPKVGSFLYVGTLGETPSKRYFFSNKDKVYIFSLSGGNGAGESYSKDAETIFDRVVRTITFN